MRCSAMFTLIFYHEPAITHTLIGIMAALTMIGGSIGAIAYKDIRQIVSYNVVIAVGFILVGLAVSTEVAITRFNLLSCPRYDY